MICLLKLTRNHFHMITYDCYENIMIKPGRIYFFDPNKNNIALLLDEKKYEYKNFSIGEKTTFYKVLMEGSICWAHWIYFDKI